MANKQQYDKFTDEDILHVQKSCFFQNNPQFDIKTPFPTLVHENKPQGPNAFIEINPPYTKEIYDPKFNLHYFKNDHNTENLVYISRNYCSGFWIREYNPILTHFLLSQEEFEKIIKKTEKIAGGFIWIKIFYIIFAISLLLSLIFIIVGCTNNSDPAEIADGDSNAFDNFDEVSNILIALGLLIFVFGFTFMILTVFCTLKKYEFAISKYFLKINEKKFLYRNIYWKVGAFCKFIQIQILPFTPQQFWLMQSKENMENHEKDKEKKKIKRINDEKS